MEEKPKKVRKTKVTKGDKQVGKGIINPYELPAMKEFLDDEENYPYENTMIKVNSRVLVCGATGAGKTVSLYHYIAKSPNTFARIIVFQIIQEQLEPFIKMLPKINCRF